MVSFLHQEGGGIGGGGVRGDREEDREDVGRRPFVYVLHKCGAPLSRWGKPRPRLTDLTWELEGAEGVECGGNADGAPPVVVKGTVTFTPVYLAHISDFATNHEIRCKHS